MRIYVGNLSFNAEEQQLQELFGSLGDVASGRLIRDRDTERSGGFSRGGGGGRQRRESGW